MTHSRRRKPVPLTKRPVVMKSRKKARLVTTKFHKLTHERQHAVASGNAERVDEIDKELQDMGGRPEYQRASQLSTSFHSTSKWVLGSLARRGWLHGIPTDSDRKPSRRATRLLEVGAINTELLDAAEEQTSDGQPKIKVTVRAIDLHSMEERIEEADMLTLPLSNPNVEERYDVVVCSMVINCVPTERDRGKLLARLYHHLRPDGLLFLTLPKYCLTRSAFLTAQIFQDMLGGDGGVGFHVEETKQSPKVAFFVCRRPKQAPKKRKIDSAWTKATIRNKGKKFPNQFSVILDENEVNTETSSA